MKLLIIVKLNPSENYCVFTTITQHISDKIISKFYIFTFRREIDLCR